MVARPMDNATMSLLLPGKVSHPNALLALRKFRDCGNKAGTVHGFETLQESNLGRLISLKPQRGATMVRCNSLCANWASSNHLGLSLFYISAIFQVRPIRYNLITRISCLSIKAYIA